MQAPFTHKNVPPVFSLVLTLEPPGLQMRSLRHRDTHKEFAQDHVARDTAGAETETQVVGPGDHADLASSQSGSESPFPRLGCWVWQCLG